MLVVTHGRVDVGAAGFVAHFEYDPAIVERIKTIQRRYWLADENVWIVEAHWPSVRRLLSIACDLGWYITPEARAAEERVRSESEELEYSVDIIHNGYGEAVFQCKLGKGDDDELLAKIQALPGAYWEGEWCVPTDWEQCCGRLREIVESDMRLEVSNAAWALLTEPDVAHLHVRSSAPPSAALRVTSPAPLVRTPSRAWTPVEHDLEMQALSAATTAEGFSVSDALRGRLLPFQVAGVRYIHAAKRALLADETGLGKTAQALAALETAGAYPALIVCPANLQQTWQREAADWLPTTRTIALWRTGATLAQADVHIVSYAALTQYQQELAAPGFAAIVADESHYLRNHASKRTQAALAIAAQVTGLRICLSGTPLPSQPIELATQLAFLGVLSSHFGGFWSFADRYCAPQQTEAGTVFGADNLEELAQRLRARCYCRREKQAVLAQLPSKTRRMRSVTLADPQVYEDTLRGCAQRLRALQAQAAESSLPSDDASEQARRVAAYKRAELGITQQVLRECGRQKIAGVARWISRFVARDEPLVVFAQHRDVLSALHAQFPQAVSLSDADTLEQRERAVRAFQDGETQLILCALSVASVPITLTRAAHLIFAEISWKAAMHTQAEDRVHRIGQQRAVTVWYLVAEDSLDSVVFRAIARKRQLSAEFDDSLLHELGQTIAEAADQRRKPRVSTRGAAPKQSKDTTPLIAAHRGPTRDS